MRSKKLKKLWGKIRLLETSAVGIPVYPAAHKSCFSLVKALSETEELVLVGDELNLEKEKMEGEPEKPKEPEKPEGEAEDSNSGSESEDKPETTEKKEETEAPEPEVEKSINKKLTALINKKVGDQVKVFMEKAFDQALKESQVPRGLVEEKADIQKAMKEKLKSMSNGELAVAMGFFQETPVLGSTKEVEI